MLIDLLVVEVAKKAAASPVGSNPTVKDVIDALFDLLQAKLVTRPILVMVLEALQQVVGLIIDQIPFPTPAPTPVPVPVTVKETEATVPVG